MRIAALWAVAAAMGFAAGAPQKTTLPPAEDRVLEAARGWALRYSRTLPDFVCTQFIRRFENWTGMEHRLDTLTFRVSYYRQRESYQLVARDGVTSRQPVDSLNGSMSRGEFGSALRFIFDPASAARFEPQKPERIRRRAVAVYAYEVRLENSHYELHYGTRKVMTAYHGRVYIDPENSRVLRLEMNVDPGPDFPIREVATTVDYDFRAIGGTQYLLPVSAAVRTLEQPGEDVLRQLSSSVAATLRGGIRYRNLIEFSKYRKFSTDSKLTFP